MAFCSACEKEAKKYVNFAKIVAKLNLNQNLLMNPKIG